MVRDPSENTKPQPGSHPGLSFLLCGLAILAAQQWVRPAVEDELRWVTYLLTAIGLGLFLAGTLLLQAKALPARLQRFLQDAEGCWRAGPSRCMWLSTGIVLAITTALAAGYGDKMRQPAAAVICWLAAIFLALRAARPSRRDEPAQHRGSMFAWAFALFLLALGLRIFNTSLIPAILSGDEASAGLFSARVAAGTVNNPFKVGWYSFPSLFFFIQSLGIQLFGQTTAALRVPSAIVGALTVSVVYLAGRAFYGHRAGVFAGILLAFSHFHINFSRIGLNNIWDGLSFALVIGSFWWAWRSEKRIGFIISGLALGFSQYMYTSARALLPILLVWLFLVFWKDKQKFRRLLPAVGWMLGITLVVVLPLAWFYAAHPNELMAPMARVGILGKWLTNTVANTGKSAGVILLGQLRDGLLAFTELPSRAWYVPGVPLLRPAYAALFLLGIALFMLEWRKRQHWLLLLWLLAFAASGALSESTPAAQRYVGALPACALTAGYAVQKVTALLTGVWKNRGGWLLAGAAVLTLLIGFDDAHFYYADYTPRSEFGGFHGQIAQHLADQLKEQAAGTVVIFSGWPEMGYDSVPSIRYLNPTVEAVNLGYPLGDTQNPALPNGRKLFVFLPAREADYQACLLLYPGGKTGQEFDSRGNLLYYYYFVKD
jgi:4-amino-4-deoxy-L-arabinose transferase-like glycosyltransferase